tara:strand:+ start:60122 stop:61765 length:1644 start_codon:yes stop_codon:yes gene_type:complete
MKKLFVCLLAITLVGCNKKADIKFPTESFKQENLSCIGRVKDVEIEYDANYIVSKNAFPKNSDGSLNQDYFLNILYYGTMYLPFSFGFVNEKAGARFMSMYPDSVDLQEIKSEETVYPYDVATIHMKGDLFGAYPPLMAQYYRGVMASGVKKGEPALKVSGKVKFRALFCLSTSATGLDSGQFEFNVPVDPQTIFEVVPKSDWLAIKNPISGDTVVTNPCINPEGVKVSADHKEMYNGDFYYFWDPALKGQSADGKEFDCSKWYKNGQNYTEIKTRIFDYKSEEKPRLPLNEIAKKPGPIDIAIIIGFQRQEYRKLDSGWLPNAIEKSLVAISSAEHKKVLPVIQRPLEEDLSVDKMLIVLWRLGMNMDIEHKEIHIESELARVELKGKLKASGKQVTVNVILGNSNSKSENYEPFKREVGKRFVTSDIFVYEGHSGFGQSLDPGNLGIQESISTLGDKAPQYQVIGLFSCQSLFSYHPSKFSQLPTIANRSWVHTLGDYRDMGANGSIAILASLEHFIVNGRQVPFNRWAKDFANDNFMMLTTQKN